LALERKLRRNAGQLIFSKKMLANWWRRLVGGTMRTPPTKVTEDDSRREWRQGHHDDIMIAQGVER